MSAVSGVGGGAAGLQQIMAMRQQIIDKSNLLQQVKTPASDAPGANGLANGPATGFTGALNNALQAVNSSQQKAEDISGAYERGEVTDVAKVMLARQEAGVAFEATLQTRNRLLSAYQDIMRMGV